MNIWVSLIRNLSILIAVLAIASWFLIGKYNDRLDRLLEKCEESKQISYLADCLSDPMYCKIKSTRLA
jgi:hypothetical protein